MSTIRIDPGHSGYVPALAPSPATGLRGASANPAPVCTDLGEKDPDPVVSVVIPAKNEATSLPTLLAELMHTFDELEYLDPVTNTTGSVTFEVIVVDDGSTDGTSQLLTSLVQRYPSLRPLCLSTSIGQSGRLVAGMRQARGTWIATLDADLQNDPADLKILWNALASHDVALGWRARRFDPRWKRIISWIANQARNRALGQSIRDTGCALRIFPRQFALRLPAFQGMHRFIGPLLLREGCQIVQVPVHHRPRRHGRSHYGFWNRSFNVVVDLLGVMWLMHRPIIHDRHESQWAPSIIQSVRKPTCRSGLREDNNPGLEDTARKEVVTTCWQQSAGF